MGIALLQYPFFYSLNFFCFYNNYQYRYSYKDYTQINIRMFSCLWIVLYIN